MQEGLSLGTSVGEAVGDAVGADVGVDVGEDVVGDDVVGEDVGSSVGDEVGPSDGDDVGLSVGDGVGLSVGMLVVVFCSATAASVSLPVVGSLSGRMTLTGSSTVSRSVGGKTAIGASVSESPVSESPPPVSGISSGRGIGSWTTSTLELSMTSGSAIVTKGSFGASVLSSATLGAVVSGCSHVGVSVAGTASEGGGVASLTPAPVDSIGAAVRGSSNPTETVISSAWSSSGFSGIKVGTKVFGAGSVISTSLVSKSSGISRFRSSTSSPSNSLSPSPSPTNPSVGSQEIKSVG